MTLIPNSLNLLMAYHAIIRTGATVIPLNVMYTAHEIRYIGQDTGARAIIADQDLWTSHASVRADLPALHQVIIAKGEPAAGEARMDSLFSGKETATRCQFRTRRYRKHHLYVRHDGSTQGGNADPSVHPFQRDGMLHA